MLLGERHSSRTLLESSLATPSKQSSVGIILSPIDLFELVGLDVVGEFAGVGTPAYNFAGFLQSRVTNPAGPIALMSCTSTTPPLSHTILKYCSCRLFVNASLECVP